MRALCITYYTISSATTLFNIITINIGYYDSWSLDAFNMNTFLLYNQYVYSLWGVLFKFCERELWIKIFKLWWQFKIALTISAALSIVTNLLILTMPLSWLSRIIDTTERLLITEFSSNLICNWLRKKFLSLVDLWLSGLDNFLAARPPRVKILVEACWGDPTKIETVIDDCVDILSTHILRTNFYNRHYLVVLFENGKHLYSVLTYVSVYLEDTFYNHFFYASCSTLSLKFWVLCVYKFFFTNITHLCDNYF